MKAMVWTAYGPPDVLQLQQVPAPLPKDDEVRIRNHAATVNAGDCEMRGLKTPYWVRLPLRMYAGLFRPQRITILGQELAGEVESVGKDVTGFKEGDPVFGFTGMRMGAYAEYTCLPENGVLAIKPANMTFEEAAAVPVGGLEALHFLRKGNIRRGDTILINGAGGSIGTLAVQLARHFGAEVTAVDSGAKLDMLRSIGAEHVIDYTREDFTGSGRSYDLIFDIVGKSPFAGSIRSLNSNGRYLIANPRLSTMVRGAWISRTGDKKVILEMTNQKKEDLVLLKQLIEAEKLRSIIDRRYPLEQVAEAHRYVETGQKKGSAVITIAPGEAR